MNPNAGEARLRRRVVYRGKILDLFVDRVRLADGRSAVREVVGHRPAVGIVALPAPGRVILVRQYRHAVRRWLWEIPAGLRERRETPLKAARRELREETGYTAKRWLALGHFFSSPGFCQEDLHIFLARDLGPRGVLNLDADEFVAPKVFSQREITLLFKRGELVDAKTVLALNLASPALNARNQPGRDAQFFRRFSIA
jgi:ADP-ribose pyrophosphatase